MATLRLQNVRLTLAAFSLEVDAELSGRVTALFGPSGAGKTSLLEVIAGLRRPRHARVQLGERVLGDSATGHFVPPERRRVGYVPQDGALFPHLGVRENLLFGQRPRPPEPNATGPRPPRRADVTLEMVTATLGIGPLLGRAGVGGLSGGERQRIALARALLAGPELLLLDEPLASLDAALKERILPYLVRVRDEFRVPMLLVTHSPAEVMALCDEVLILERGRVVAQGAPAALFEPARELAYVLRRANTGRAEKGNR